MPKQFLVATVLAAALLLSQEGTLLVAALCSHLQSGMASCERQPAAGSMSHDDMAHMSHEDMGDMADMQMEPEPASDLDADGFAMSQPIDPCTHCAMHSRTSPTFASFKGMEAAKRSVDLTIPLNVSRVAPVSLSPVAVLTSRAHGPPGEARPRHILINIFRI